MKYIFFLMIIFSGSTLFGQQQPAAKAKTSPADKIKQYWFVLLTTGPNTEADSTSKAILFEKHMSNMEKLYNEGILKIAGPFGKNDKQWRGLFVFDCASRAEAEKIVQTDPAIAAGLLAADITSWYTEPTGSFKKGKPEKAN